MLSLCLKKESVKDFARGNPWIFKGMINMTSELEMSEAGSLVQILDNRTKPLGIGYLNPNNILACRVLSFQPNMVINQHFFHNLFTKALEKRRKIFDNNFFRLIHSESDNIPGLVVDCFGNVIVCQTSTAGMEKLKSLWLPALQDILKPESIIFRDDVPARKKEKLPTQVSIYCGTIPEFIEVQEHNRLYYANLLTGQKTGWFYDQRANRTYLSTLVKDKTVLDLYSHSGGFGIASAKGEANHVTMVDSSALALELARKATILNDVSQCSFVQSDAYDYLELCVKENRKFDVVMADPPAFIKERKYIMSGLKGYQKLAFLCATSTKQEGIFCIASCSHHASESSLKRAVEDGIRKAGRKYKLIHKAGADKDHPVHPALPESSYLKFLAYRLD